MRRYRISVRPDDGNGPEYGVVVGIAAGVVFWVLVALIVIGVMAL
jgi:hypothetical protein